MITKVGVEEQVRLWDGCQAYWKLDETSGTIVADSVGGNNGVATSITWNANGKNSYCASFNANTDKIVMGNNLVFERTQPWTFSMWVKRSEVTSSTYMLVSKSTSYTQGYALYFTQYNDYLEFNVAGTSTKRFYGTTTNRFSGTTNWYHIVWTYAGTSNYAGNHIYVNGVEESFTGANQGTFDATIVTTAPFVLGNRNTESLGFNGLMDEVGVWNRVLNEAEVKALYSNGNGKFYGTKQIIQSPKQITGLRAWYGSYVNNGTLRTTLADSAAITQWDDLSGNGFHLDNVSGSTTYNATKNAITLTNGALYNVSHNIVTGSTARTIFNVQEASNTSTLTDILHLGLYDGNSHEWGENMRNADYTIASNNGYRRFTTTNSNNTKYQFTTQFEGTSIANNATCRKNGILLGLGASASGNLNNYVGIIVGGYFGVGTYTPVPRGSGLSAYEIIIYNRILTGTEIMQVENYLKSKYSIT